jgi:hypothetical protein
MTCRLGHEVLEIRGTFTNNKTLNVLDLKKQILEIITFCILFVVCFPRLQRFMPHHKFWSHFSAVIPVT